MCYSDDDGGLCENLNDNLNDDIDQGMDPSYVNCFVSGAPLDSNGTILKCFSYSIHPMFLVIQIALYYSLIHIY